MQKLKALNRKEIKEIQKQLQDQWSASYDQDLAWLENNTNRIFLLNKEVSTLDLSKLRINSMGLYFGERVKAHFRLSIEGSQLVGPEAKTNVFEISSKQASEWMMGEDLKCPEDLLGYQIIKSGTDYLGCGFAKEGEIKNYVGKNRRVSAVHD